MACSLFDAEGFQAIPQALPADDCAELAEQLQSFPPPSAGTRRLLSHTGCLSTAERLRRSPPLAKLIPSHYVVAQCIYFEKSTDRNWLVAGHQDLSIPVAERVEHPALQGWSKKEGTWYVQPPVEFLERLTAVRLHLDPCGLDDGPLRVAPGSHRLGRIDPTAHPLELGTSCSAERGDALALRPLLWHGSGKASGASRRRVLHYLFGPSELPHGLRWPAF